MKLPVWRDHQPFVLTHEGGTHLDQGGKKVIRVRLQAEGELPVEIGSHGVWCSQRRRRRDKAIGPLDDNRPRRIRWWRRIMSRVRGNVQIRWHDGNLHLA